MRVKGTPHWKKAAAAQGEGGSCSSILTPVRMAQGPPSFLGGPSSVYIMSCHIRVCEVMVWMVSEYVRWRPPQGLNEKHHDGFKDPLEPIQNIVAGSRVAET